MLENCSAKERWGGVSDLIDRWLRARQQLIVTFCDLSRMQQDLTRAEKVQSSLSRFCELLVDYVSAGHFEVYDQLIQEAREFDDGGMDLVNRAYPRIEKTTEAALEFNDRFDGIDGSEQDLRVLFEQLSPLGETLEERFELEDLLIETLHNAHADQVA